MTGGSRQTARWTALAMTACSAGTLAAMSGSWTYAAATVLLGVLGAMGRMRMRVSPERRMILGLILASLFALKHRFAPYDADVSVGLMEQIFSLAYGAGQFLVALQVLQLFLQHEAGAPRVTALYGALTMICAGIIEPQGWQTGTYRALGLTYVALMGLFFMSRQVDARAAASPQEQAGSSRSGRGAMAWTAIAAVILIGGMLGQVFAITMERYESDVMNLMEHHPLNPEFSDATGWTDRPGLERSVRIRNSAKASAVAVRVVSETAPGYLRGGAYESFAIDHWASADSRTRLDPVEQAPAELPETRAGALFLIRPLAAPPYRAMQVWTDPQSQQAMFAPLEAVAVAAPVDRAELDEHRIVEFDDLPAGIDFEVVAGRIPAPEALGDELRQRCLGVPAYLKETLETYAGGIFEGVRTPLEKMRAVSAYFRTRYRYRLGIDVPADEERIEYFLRERPPAHCEYFASATVLLLRAAGVPARYVTGLVALEWNEAGGYWLARNRDAHAWVEAYDDASGRWRIVESTPSEGVPRQETANPLAGLWDALTYQMLRLRVMIWRDGVKGALAWIWQAVRWSAVALVTSLPGLVILTAVAVLAGRRLWRRWVRRRERAAARRRLSPIVIALRGLLARMDRQMGNAGLRRRPSETLLQFAGRLREAHPRRAGWYERYADVRYSDRVSEAAVAELEIALREAEAEE